MNDSHSKWKTSELAETFLQGVRGAIPAASLQLEVLGKIVSMWRPAPSEVLDLGCGDGILGCTLLDAHAAAHVTFADFSEPMLEAARKQIGYNKKATIIKADFGTPDWMRKLCKTGMYPFVHLVSISIIAPFLKTSSNFFN